MEKRRKSLESIWPAPDAMRIALGLAALLIAGCGPSGVADSPVDAAPDSDPEAGERLQCTDFPGAIEGASGRRLEDGAVGVYFCFGNGGHYCEVSRVVDSLESPCKEWEQSGFSIATSSGGTDAIALEVDHWGFVFHGAYPGGASGDGLRAWVPAGTFATVVFGHWRHGRYDVKFRSNGTRFEFESIVWHEP